MMNKKIQVWLPLLFSVAMIAGMYLGYQMRDNMPGKSFFYTEKRRPVQEIMDLIKSRYVDEINTTQLADTAIQAMLSKLDPHSVFIPAEQLEQVNEDLAGKFFGIGIEFNIFDDTLNVINVIPGGPGDKEGLLTGDKFLKVGDSVITGKKLDPDRYRKLLRGDRGTSVNISFLREQQQKQVTLTREAIPLSSIDAAYMMGNKAGYIRLNKFSSQTYHEFMEALESLKKEGLQKLVLDLRGNGGGILGEAVEIADEFLDGDKLITYTEGKHVAKKEYRCRRVGQFEKEPLIVLADEGTASASEVLIGALQDWDRALVIGRRTFGKGLVQEQFDLSDHSALRLTIARYYTPIGRSIQRPYAKGEKAYYEEIIHRYYDGEMQTSDSVKNDTSKVYKTSKEKTVYGGGGISPDLFVPLDTMVMSSNPASLSMRTFINNFTYHYYLQHLGQMKTYKDPRDFINRFQFTDENWNAFLQESARDSLHINVNIPVIRKKAIIDQIRATIAHQIWRSEGYFEVINVSDEAIKKAMDQISR